MIGVLENIGYHSRNVSEALVGLNDDVPTDEEIATTAKFNFYCLI